jgi:hypothetical protein
MSIGYSGPSIAPNSPALTGLPTINGAPVRGSARGAAVFTGTGVQTAFLIPHGLGVVPSSVSCEAGSTVATALMGVTALDATNITVTFLVAPAAGAGNITLYWAAFV